MRVVTARDPRRPSARPVTVRDTKLGRRRPSRAEGVSSRPPERTKRAKPPSDADLALLFSNIATLLNSGIPLTRALETLIADESLAKSAPTLEALIQDIRSGSSFSAALAKHPEAFSPMVMSLVRAGEASGTLVASLERLAQGIEERRETIGQIRQTLTYPGIVTVLGSAAIGFLMIFVVPVFEESYAKAGMPLPSITLALIAISKLVAKTWWLAILIFVSLAMLYWNYRSHPQVQSLRDRLLLGLPIIGPVVQGALVGRFVRTFGNLLTGGISVKESLALTERVVKNSEFANMVHELRLAVDRGEGVGPKLSEYKSLMPPLLVRMIILGEKSGDLANMVMHVGQYAEKELKRRMKRMTTLIEPVITIVMAAIIGTIAMAIYLPMFDMIKHIS